MRTFCRQLSSRLLLPGIAALVLCSFGCSRNTAVGTAEKFYSDALTAIRLHQYDDAEHLLAASLVLFQQAENPEKYNEVVTTLAGLERSRGKLSLAFDHYNGALSYYRQSQNTARLVPVLNALADLYAFTGKRDSASLCSSLALHMSGVAGNDGLKAASEYERGRVALMFNDPEAAAAHFSAVTASPAGLSDPLFVLDLALYHGTALTRLGRKTEAIQKFHEAERFAVVSNDVLASVHLQSALGASYLQFGMYEDAMSAFNGGLTLDSAAGTSGSSGMPTQLLCGMGEVFLANYAHSSARACFSKALERARADEDIDVIGYCLVRLGDCDAQSAMPSPTGSSVLQAVSLYEQAYTLYESDATPQRKALALWKEAALRDALHEDADAERLYKRSFELMKSAAVATELFTEPYRITTPLRLLPNGVRHDDWWYRPYASFLLHKRRIGDALAVMTDGTASTGRAALFDYSFAFQDTVRNAKVASYVGRVRSSIVTECELLIQQTLSRALVDEQANAAGQARYVSMRDGVKTDVSEISSRYPSLLPLLNTPAVSFESIQKRVTEETSILSYQALDGRLFAIVISAKNGAVAVDLGASLAFDPRGRIARGEFGAACAVASPRRGTRAAR